MRTSSGRRWLLGVGVVLILSGLGVLGLAAWQYIGTTVVSHRHQEEAVAQLREEWSSGQAAVRTDWGTVEAIVRIPRFGDDYVMPVLAGTADDALAAGIGHFDGTADPGEVGNYALAGHRITHGEPLRRMRELQVGDAVIVETEQERLTYRLITAGDDLEVDDDAAWVLDPVPDNPDPGGTEPPQVPGQRLLTLTTCAELFHTDQRLVAFAELESSEPRE